MKSVVLNVDGMTCSACSSGLEKYLKKQDGIYDSSVNLVLATVRIDYNETKVDMNKLIKFISEAGFEFNGEQYSEKKRKPEKLLLIIFFILIIFIMYVSMGHMIGMSVPDFVNMTVNPINYVSVLAIMSLCYLIYGFDIIKSGFKNLINKMPNMDTLVSVGVIINYLYSCYNMFLVIKGNYNFVHYLYFEASAMTILFVKLGRFIDKKNKIKATEAVKGLVNITPKKAILLRDGIEEIVDINEIIKGDILVCKPGEKFAVDGVVVDGETNVDESFITGESKSVSKHVGDEVTAGSINYDGYVKYQAVKIGRDSNVSNIVKMVVEATNSKPKIQMFADKVSSIFVVVIFCIAVLSGILNFIFKKDVLEVINGIVTVLVVACPCALGLATPLAMVISIGKLGKNGVFIKSSETLELIKKIKNVVFDKTGTLTIGKMKIVDLKISDDMFNILQNIEFNSKHPIAVSICEYSNFKRVEVKNFRDISGYGVQGDVNGVTYYVGNSKFVKEQHVSNSYISDEKEFLDNGYTIVYLFNKDGVFGILGLSDVIKSSAKETISLLKKMNKNVYMLTGDNNASAMVVARKIGIDNVISDVTPKEKLINISNLNDDNSVMMVGDGINDSPSLKSATIGVSVKGGTDISADSSDVILINPDINVIGMIFNVGDETFKIIKENLFWALFYNCLMIPIATGLFPIHINPMIASFAMMVSSLTVVFNSLRLL